MSASRFFAVIERINTLVLFAIGIGGLLIVGAVIWEGLTDWLRPVVQPSVVSVGRTGTDHQDVSLGSFEHLTGQDVITAELRSDDRDTMAFSSGGNPSHVLNYLMFDISTSNASWLLPNNDSIIPWRRLVMKGVADDPSRHVVAILYRVIDSDTNGDGHLSGDDRGSILISDPDGTRLQTLISGVESIEYFDDGQDGQGHLFYVSNGKLRVARLDFVTMELLNDRDLSETTHPEQYLPSQGE